jgi:hypothetical protein
MVIILLEELMVYKLVLRINIGAQAVHHVLLHEAFEMELPNTIRTAAFGDQASDVSLLSSLR